MTWLRRKTPAPSTVSARRRGGRFARLALEGLEDRTLLDAGFLDPTFGTGGRVLTDFTGTFGDAARGVATQAGDKLVVAGTAASGVDGRGDFALARYLATGALDVTFGTGGRVFTSFGAPSQAHAVIAQVDGKIIVAGSAGTNMALARYLDNGTLDLDFGTGGLVTFTFPVGVVGGTAVAYSLVLQDDDKIVAVGGCGLSRVLARLDADGELDPAFGAGGKIGDCTTAGHTALVSARVALQPDLKIVMAAAFTGSGSGINLRRYNVDGSLDRSFGVQGVRATPLGIDLGSSGPGLRVQEDGKILVAGALPTANVTQALPGIGFGVVRYNLDGTLDAGFGNQGVVTLDFGGRYSAADVLLDVDGQIVVVGSSNELSATGTFNLVVTRLLANGKLNTSFGVAGKVAVAVGATVSPAAGAVLQDDGKLVVVGAAPGAGTANDFLLTRFDLEDTFTTTNERYVGQLYLNLLGRPTDPAGFAAFVDLLDRGAVTRDGLARIVTASVEYRTKVVRDLYRTLLGREADSAGEGHFVGLLGSGGTVAQVKATMLGSAEYFQNRTDRTNNGFITALYRDVLGREPDPAGRAAFLQQLNTGTSRDVVAFRVVTSRESLERIVQGWYRQYLRRGAEPTGLAAFANFLQAGGREEVAIGILLSSAEFVGGL